MLDYRSLSRHERRAAKKLAKELLRTVPAAQKPKVKNNAQYVGR